MKYKKNKRPTLKTKGEMDELNENECEYSSEYSDATDPDPDLDPTDNIMEISDNDKPGASDDIDDFIGVPFNTYTLDVSMVVDNMAAEFTCSICKLMAEDPCEIDGCGHVFCRVCIDTWINITITGGSEVINCPVCKGEFVPRMSRQSLKMTRVINSMVTKCSHCNWSGSIMEFKKHRNHRDKKNRCSKIQVVCKKCGDSVASESLEKHMVMSCLYRLTSCDSCDSEFAFKNLENHLENHCKATIFTCDQMCGYKGNRDDFSKHKETCVYCIVECRYHIYGCNEKVMRKDMTTHMTLKGGLKHHSVLMEQRLKIVHERMNQMGVIIDFSKLKEGQCVLYRSEYATIKKILPEGKLELHFEFEDGSKTTEVIDQQCRFLQTI